MKRTFTKAEVIKFLGCNENTRPCRIIEALENFGFKNVEKVGRGNKITYIYANNQMIQMNNAIIYSKIF